MPCPQLWIIRYREPQRRPPHPPSAGLAALGAPGRSRFKAGGTVTPGTGYCPHMETRTKQQQTYAVSTGLALGLLLAGQPELAGNRTTVELSFRSAWRAWPHADHFPAVGAEVRAGRFNMPQMTATRGRRGVNGFISWSEGHPPAAMVTPGVEWDAANPEDAEFLAAQATPGVSPDAWRELARLLLDRIGQ